MSERDPSAGSYADRYFAMRRHEPREKAHAPASGTQGAAAFGGAFPSDRGHPAGSGASYADRYLGHRSSESAETSGPAAEPGTEPPHAAGSEGGTGASAAPPIEGETRAARPLVPRAPETHLSGRAKAQLDQNLQQLSLIEGNLTAAGHGEIKTIYITSCFRGEGKTTAALSAAYGLATLSRARVLLVDGNPTAPRLHTLLPCAASPGWTDVLCGETLTEQAIHPTDVPRLHFMAAGSPADVLGAPGTERSDAFLDRVRPHYDFVVIDGVSMFASSDALRISPLVDGVAFVIAAARTKWDVVRDATEKTKSMGGNVLGGIINRRKFYLPRSIYKWLSR